MKIKKAVDMLKIAKGSSDPPSPVIILLNIIHGERIRKV